MLYSLNKQVHESCKVNNKPLKPSYSQTHMTDYTLKGLHPYPSPHTCIYSPAYQFKF